MSVIDLKQGAVKISEVAVDSAQPVLATAVNEDALTALIQLRNIISNLLRKSSFLMTSDGTITWNGTNIVNNGNNVFLKFNQNPTVGTVTIMIPTALLSTYTLGNANILYFQASRSALTSSFTASGSNIVVAPEGSMPAGQSVQSDSATDPTITVPILARYDIGSNQSVWWVPHGIYWPQNTSSVVGSIISNTTSPIGSMLPWHRFGDRMPLGSPAVEVIAPGWNLCNGCVIINQQSAFSNPGRNADGFPNVSYSSAADRFTPQLNGYLQLWQNAFGYVRGDLVRDSGTTREWAALSSFTTSSGVSGLDINSALPATWSSGTAYTAGQYVIWTEASVNGSGQSFTATYKAINNVGPSVTTPFNDTTNWQKIWATDLSQNGNPFRRSNVNVGNAQDGSNPPTYIRGSTSSPSGAGGYGSANNQIISRAQLPVHDHGGPSFASAGHQHILPFGNSGVNTFFAVNASANSWQFSAALITMNPASHLYDFAGSSNTVVFRAGANEGPISAFMPYSNTPTASSSVGNDGSSAVFENEPRYFGALYIIKIY
jgi:hypothetical protein